MAAPVVAAKEFVAGPRVIQAHFLALVECHQILEKIKLIVDGGSLHSRDKLVI